MNKFFNTIKACFYIKFFCFLLKVQLNFPLPLHRCIQVDKGLFHNVQGIDYYFYYYLEYKI